MPEAPPSSPDRIDRALARIKAAIAARDAATAALADRHDALRRQTADAVAALDSLIGPRDG